MEFEYLEEPRNKVMLETVAYCHTCEKFIDDRSYTYMIGRVKSEWVLHDMEILARKKYDE